MTEHAGFLLLQAAPGGPGQSPLGMLVPFAAIFVIFYFLLIRPQQKRQKEQEVLVRVRRAGLVAHEKNLHPLRPEGAGS